jgi:hypothetical protein
LLRAGAKKTLAEEEHASRGLLQNLDQPYYLTQVPLLGALSYGHGLIFYLVPPGLLLGVSLLRPYVGR